jgi:hypothetical protein
VSFVRFGSDGSQVYIYDDYERDKVCCFCALTERLPDRTDAEIAALWLPEALLEDRERFRAQYAPDFATNDLDAMLAHIAEHRAAGHVVPEWVDQVLRDEWEDE